MAMQSFKASFQFFFFLSDFVLIFFFGHFLVFLLTSLNILFYFIFILDLVIVICFVLDPFLFRLSFSISSLDILLVENLIS